ncbi:actin family protein [Sessilibacter corallicola]|uniref:Actin n=1 Tax=Sessilibacter corallicola TaxID=2904075 RepID=A0ABQ0ADY7_9GAMM
MSGKTVIIDNGTNYIQAGFNGEDAPKVIIPALVARSGSEVFCGEEAAAKTGTLAVNCPLEHGIIDNWDDMVELWRYTFEKLGVDPSSSPVLLTVKPLTTKSDRQNILTVFFDKLNVPAVSVCTNTIMSLFAVGRNTGLVAHSGGGVTHVVPILDGHLKAHGDIRLDLGGQDVTDNLVKSIRDKGHAVSPNDVKAINQLKESHGYIAYSYEDELKKEVAQHSLTLESGATVTLSSELFKAPELMMKPELVGMEAPGLSETIYNSIMKCDVDDRKHYYANIVLGGFNTSFPGIAERVHKELSTLAPATMKINVIAPPDRKISSWVGGSIMASLGIFSNILVTRDLYEKNGPSAVGICIF